MRAKAIVAIVSGHTRGLGAALAQTLLSRGIDVLAISRRRNGGLAAQHAGTLQEIELDLADLSALDGWLAGRPL